MINAVFSKDKDNEFKFSLKLNPTRQSTRSELQFDSIFIYPKIELFILLGIQSLYYLMKSSEIMNFKFF